MCGQSEGWDSLVGESGVWREGRQPQFRSLVNEWSLSEPLLLHLRRFRSVADKNLLPRAGRQYW